MEIFRHIKVFFTWITFVVVKKSGFDMQGKALKAILCITSGFVIYEKCMLCKNVLGFKKIQKTIPGYFYLFCRNDILIASICNILEPHTYVYLYRIILFA